MATPSSGSPGLPDPDSDEIRNLFSNEEVRIAYEFLLSRRDDPPTMVEWREHSAQRMGKVHSQSDRRLRQVREWFEVRSERSSRGDWVYFLTGRRTDANASGGGGRISSRVEAKVYEDYGYRCAMCGKSPQQDAVRLHMDHKIPRAWGGTDEAENLQPLCTEHNHGKQSHFATFDKYAEEIRQAIGLSEVHMRIGELLKAFKGDWVPIDLLLLVAREENRGDPTRRLRELKTLGWEYEWKKEKVGARTMSYYRLTRSAPWPPEGPREEVNRIERERKRRKRDEGS